jgi:hypothetical protein
MERQQRDRIGRVYKRGDAMPAGERYRKLGEACLAQAVMMADSAARATVLMIAQAYMRLADHLSVSGERDAARDERTALENDSQG